MNRKDIANHRDDLVWAITEAQHAAYNADENFDVRISDGEVQIVQSAFEDGGYVLMPAVPQGTDPEQAADEIIERETEIAEMQAADD